MSKRKLKGVVLLTGLLALGSIAVTGLASCGPTNEPGGETDKITSIAISNKAELTAQWKLGEADRTVRLTVAPTMNVADAIMSGDILVNSSDSSIIFASGEKLQAKKAGTATITYKSATNNQVKDEVTITVLDRDSVEVTSIADILKMGKGQTVNARGKVVQISNGGFYIAEGTNFIYVYQQIQSGISVGDTITIVGAKTDVYGEINQLKSPGEMYKETTNIVDATVNYVAKTGAELNDYVAKDDGAIAIKTTLTVCNAKAANSETKILWRADGMNDNTCVYTGYIEENVFAGLNLKVNDRYEIEGFIGGSGEHDEDGFVFSKRLNLYPVTFNKVESVAVTTITLTAEETQLDQNQSTVLDVEFGPNGNAYAEIEFEVTEGSNLLEVSGYKLIAKEGSAGTAKVIAKSKDGNVTSEPLTITVSDQLYLPKTLEELYAAPNGKTFYAKAIYMGDYKAGQNYGSYVQAGNRAVILYGFDSSKVTGLTVGSKVTVLGKKNVHENLTQMTDAIVKVDNELEVTEPVALDLATSTSDLTLEDANRIVAAKGKLKDDAKTNDYGNVTFTLVYGDSNKEIYCNADSRYVSSTILTTLKGLKANQEVEFTANVMIKERSDTDSSPSYSLVNLRDVVPGEGGEVTPPDPVEPEGNVVRTINLGSLDFGTSYKAAKSVAVDGGTINVSNGMSGTDSWGPALVVGVNKVDNLDGKVSSKYLSLIDSSLTEDSNTFTLDGTTTYASSLEFSFDVENVKSFQLKQKADKYLPSQTTGMYLFESLDSGNTYTLASKIAVSDATGYNLEYTRETVADSVRYSLVFTYDNAKNARYAFTDVNYFGE